MWQEEFEWNTGIWFDEYDTFLDDNFTDEQRVACGPVCYSLLLDWASIDSHSFPIRNDVKHHSMVVHSKHVKPGKKYRVEVIPYLCNDKNVSGETAAFEAVITGRAAISDKIEYTLDWPNMIK